MAITKVALVGASGTLGLPILEALLGARIFQVTVVQRASSSASAVPDVRTVVVDDDMTVESLTAALAGQDACIACFRPRDPGAHFRLADAAAAAGVRRYIPADYGSCDSSSQRAQELVPLFLNKERVRARLQEHADRDARFTWTALVAGHFFDWGLRERFLHFDLATCTADILDEGTLRSSTSTLARIADAVVRVLRDEYADVSRNRMLFIQSFCVSQLDVLASLEKATGQKWKINWLKSDEFISEYKAKADAGDAEANEELVFALGAIDGNWEQKEGFAMKALGLENEDLDEIVQKVVAEQAS
jgi:uncharacterized protein YbjT (DUF2867 family)